MERKKKLADGKPEPKIDLRKDNSVSNILSHFKKDFNDNEKVPDSIEKPNWVKKWLGKWLEK